ncbi:hypothetical protein JCGZ_03132 [Jatropha curcas]|uniref:Aminotransferase-like plant mobile domain-containing protein n=1 Tax=Jatropha curcas TaxID=180498 RepID=A0A067LCV7_JATCU|nr:hypothetical protein JCGZ_03132 [Jatropha curcas]
MVFRFEDSEVTPTYEEMCAVMGHHPEQDETPALPPGPRLDLAEIATLCPVYLPDGINPDQGLPLEPFLNRVLSMDVDPSWVRACCFLLLNMYAMKNRQPGIGDFRLLTVVRDMQVYRRTVFMMIMGGDKVLDRSMAYFPDRISRQYDMIQRVPRIHDFESGPMTQSLLTNLTDRWRNRNTWYLGQGMMQDTVTPEYVDWFYTQ